MIEKHLQLDSLRHDAVRKLVRSQEWAGTAVQELTSAVGKLCGTTPKPLTPVAHATLTDSILSLCDHISMAAEVGMAAVFTASKEEEELRGNIAEMNTRVEDEERQVRQLREVLAREKRLAERRGQYEALAEVILSEPSVGESQKRLDEEKVELGEVQKEMDRISETRDAMAKEMQLFSHCVASLDAFSKQVVQLLEGKEEEEENAAMDTSN